MNDLCPISVLIPTKNEARNLRKCLDSIVGWASEIIVVDSGSTDGTIDIALGLGATVIHFDYHGGWPKKRNWALETFKWANEWVLLLDADEILSEGNRREIGVSIQREGVDGYWLCFQIHFLGRQLKFGDTELWKLSLFRHRLGRYERRLVDQDASMGDMEVHEHVVVNGAVSRLFSPIRHENVNSLSRYIDKHNEYSNWEAKVFFDGRAGINASLFGTQAQRRRWLKCKCLFLPGFPLLVFFYVWFVRGGIFDGVPGLIYAGFRAVQYFHIKAKVFELKLEATRP